MATLVAGLLCVSLAACRSAFIETTLRNDGDTPIRLIEVDYPSASFGTQSVAPHSVYHYHFKVQGSGAVTLTFTSADGKLHSTTGPKLDEGQHGTLVIAVDPVSKVTWTESLSTTK
ncbi:MAG TPA: hypothetical protein VGG15_10635 [Terriglobales bacterium]